MTRRHKSQSQRQQLQLLQLPLRKSADLTESHAAARASASSSERTGPQGPAKPIQRHRLLHQVPWSIPTGVRCDSLAHNMGGGTSGPLQGRAVKGLKDEDYPSPTVGGSAR